MSDRQKQIQALALRLMRELNMRKFEAISEAVALIDYQRGHRK